MKLVILFLTTIVFVAAVKRCPPPEQIAPCRCYSHNNVACFGLQVTGEKLKTALSRPYDSIEWDELKLSNTSIDKISKDMFGTLKFEDIIIENNRLLTSIDADAFSNSKKLADKLRVSGSPKITSDLFELVKSFDRLSNVALDRVGLKEVPANALTPKSGSTLGQFLKEVSLIRNNITKVGSYAFSNLTVIKNVYLTENQIIKLDANSLSVQKSASNNENTYIRLGKNNITDDSFDTKALETEKNVKLNLVLDYNKITTVKEDIFKKPLTEGGLMKVSLVRNPLKCDCGMKWMMDLKVQLETKFVSIGCGKNLTNFFKLKKSHFDNCTKIW